MSTAAIAEIPSNATLKLLLDDTINVQGQIIETLGGLVGYAETIERRLGALEAMASKPIEVIVKLPKKRTVLIFVAGAFTYAVLKKNARKIETWADNANTGAKMRITEPEKFAGYTTRVQPNPTVNGEVASDDPTV